MPVSRRAFLEGVTWGASAAVLTDGTAANAAPGVSLPRPLRSVLGARDWLNTEPLTADDLRGKVVLVNFWTYSCINVLRTLPYLRAWAERYRDCGLVVIGVHSPEFDFETDLANVREGVAANAVAHPVAIDSTHAIWRAFGNQAWPAFYFIGADGRVAKRVYGEGGYDRSERLIQRLLSDATGETIADPVAAVTGHGVEAPPDFANLRTPETYLGRARTTNFASAGGIRRDETKVYPARPPLALNHWSLTGRWRVTEAFAVPVEAAGRIAFRFHARDLHLVMGPAAVGRRVLFRVTVDGAAPGASRGVDVDEQGQGVMQASRMYQLIRTAGPIADRTFEIEFSGDAVRAYAFTFG